MLDIHKMKKKVNVPFQMFLTAISGSSFFLFTTMYSVFPITADYLSSNETFHIVPFVFLLPTVYAFKRINKLDFGVAFTFIVFIIMLTLYWTIYGLFLLYFIPMFASIYSTLAVKDKSRNWNEKIERMEMGGSQ